MKTAILLSLILGAFHSAAWQGKKEIFNRLLENGYTKEQVSFKNLISMIEQDEYPEGMDKFTAYHFLSRYFPHPDANYDFHFPFPEEAGIQVLDLMKRAHKSENEQVDLLRLSLVLSAIPEASYEFLDKIRATAMTLPDEDARRQLLLVLIKFKHHKEESLADLLRMHNGFEAGSVMRTLIALDFLRTGVFVDLAEASLTENLMVSEESASAVFLFASGSYMDSLTPVVIEGMTEALKMFPEKELRMRIGEINKIREHHWMDLLPVPEVKCSGLFEEGFRLKIRPAGQDSNGKTIH